MSHSEISTPPRSLTQAVGPDEPFTRFLLHRSAFNANQLRVYPPALLPRDNTERRRLETSIHRTDGLRNDAIWTLGYECVEDQAKR